MRILRAVFAFVGGVIGTAITLAVALLALRGFAEYIPAIAGFLPIRTIINWTDPFLMRWTQAAGLPWSHHVRGAGLIGAAVAVIVARGMVVNLVRAVKRAAEKPQPAAPVPAPAPASTAPQPAPNYQSVTGTAFIGSGKAPSAGAAQPDPAATVITPGRVQSVTGTAFIGSATPAPSVRRIGRYEILGELGRGAMGTVYKAQDPKIGRVVAIKTISAAASAGMDAELYRARFLQEAKSAGRLNHPGIVAVHDVAEDENGRPCLVLEFVEGDTLDRMLAAGPLPLPRALDLLAQVARALAFAHGQGVIHRDVKPANVMVTGKGTAKLSDFGIAKVEGTTMTMTGQILGTPAYMSPEQCTGSAAVDHRSDIFSLGAVLYTVVTGSKPFPGETFTTVSYKVAHVRQAPVRELNPALPEALEGIVERCLAKDPAQRYAWATQLAEDLEALV